MTWAAISKAWQKVAESGSECFNSGQVCDGRCFCLTTELTVMLMHLKYDS